MLQMNVRNHCVIGVDFVKSLLIKASRFEFEEEKRNTTGAPEIRVFLEGRGLLHISTSGDDVIQKNHTFYYTDSLYCTSVCQFGHYTRNTVNMFTYQGRVKR